jgi:hypothetical protein
MTKNDILQDIGLLSPLQTSRKEKKLEQKYFKFLCSLKAGEDHNSIFFDDVRDKFLWSDFEKIFQNEPLGELFFGLTCYYWPVLCEEWSPKIEVRNFSQDWVIILYFGKDRYKKPLESPAIIGFASKKTLLISTGYALTGNKIPLFNDEVWNLIDLYGPYAEFQGWGELEEELLTICCRRISYDSDYRPETKDVEWEEYGNGNYGSYLLKLKRSQLELMKRTFKSLSSEKCLTFLEMILELLESLSDSWSDTEQLDNNFELFLMKFGFPDNELCFNRVEKEYFKKKRLEFEARQVKVEKLRLKEEKLKKVPVLSPYDFPRDKRVLRLEEMEIASLKKWMNKLPGIKNCSIEKGGSSFGFRKVTISWKSNGIWHEKSCRNFRGENKGDDMRMNTRLLTFFKFILGDKMPKNPAQATKAK